MFQKTSVTKWTPLRFSRPNFQLSTDDVASKEIRFGAGDMKERNMFGAEALGFSHCNTRKRWVWRQFNKFKLQPGK